MREDLEQKLTRLTQFAEQKQQQADQLQSDMANLRVTRKSGDGLLTATVTANGQLVDLKIDDRALRNGRELAASVLNVVFQASAAAAEQVKEIAAPLLAESSIDVGDLGIGATPPVQPGGQPGQPPLQQQPPYQQQPPQPPRPPQPPYGQPPQQPPARRPPVDDDPDDGNSSIFQSDGRW